MLKLEPCSFPALPAAPDPAGHRLPVLLRRAWYGLNQAFRRRIVHLNLTPDQYTVLRTLSENPGISQKRLAQLMASDPNTIASLLERMEGSGWVERKRQRQDRRVHCLRLRPAGRRKYNSACSIALQLQQEILGGLPEPQQTAFLAQLALIAEASQSASQSPHPVGWGAPPQS